MSSSTPVMAFSIVSFSANPIARLVSPKAAINALMSTPIVESAVRKASVMPANGNHARQGMFDGYTAGRAAHGAHDQMLNEARDQVTQRKNEQTDDQALQQQRRCGHRFVDFLVISVQDIHLLCSFA